MIAFCGLLSSVGVQARTGAWVQPETDWPQRACRVAAEAEAGAAAVVVLVVVVAAVVAVAVVGVEVEVEK